MSPKWLRTMRRMPRKKLSITSSSTQATLTATADKMVRNGVTAQAYDDPASTFLFHIPILSRVLCQRSHDQSRAIRDASSCVPDCRNADIGFRRDIHNLRKVVDLICNGWE